MGNDLFVWLIGAASFAMFLISVILLRRIASQQASAASLSAGLDRLERLVQEELRGTRREIAESIQRQSDAAASASATASQRFSTDAAQLRTELRESLAGFGETLQAALTSISGRTDTLTASLAENLTALNTRIAEELSQIRQDSLSSAGMLRDRLTSSLSDSTETARQKIGEMAAQQQAQWECFRSEVEKLRAAVEARLDAVRRQMDDRLREVQHDNSTKLEAMRQTVEEKLQTTLETRLGESFRLVSERLEQVAKGLGEMQTLATGVGDLKRVLANVKARGTWGEVQLENLLEQVLARDQYVVNAQTKDGSGERVEFAVRLPGRSGNADEVVLLPIDAKFPLEDYQALVEASERADVPAMEEAGRSLEARVRACAKDISSKYVNPPRTTDFAILFLPVEGLYAEVLRRPGLAEIVQREYRIMLAGPTTLLALLNSLQMGFRTLAIERRSSEVWALLGAVKTEFSKFGTVLDGVQKNLSQAASKIETAKKGTRNISKKLSEVQQLPAADAAGLLDGVVLEVEEEIAAGA